MVNSARAQDDISGSETPESAGLDLRVPEGGSEFTHDFGESIDLKSEPQAKRVTVLHVIEAYGGGIEAAFSDWIQSSKGVDHVLLRAVRTHNQIHQDVSVNLRAVLDLPRNPILSLRSIARAYADVQPDFVHAHSSVAGALVRLVPTIPTRKIIYSPHCFPFDRQDTKPLIRTGYKLLEYLLASRVGRFGLVSPHERNQATNLRRNARVIVVPIVLDDSVQERPEPIASPGAALRVLGVGRICPQKDPDMFAEICTLVTHAGIAAEFTWVGDGDAKARGKLESSGVRVTGWQSREQTLDLLERADLLLHTARWEGSPVVVAEARAIGLPVVARDIPAIKDLELRCTGETPEALADWIGALQNPAVRMSVAHQQKVDLGRRKAERSRAIEALYGRVQH